MARTGIRRSKKRPNNADSQKSKSVKIGPSAAVIGIVIAALFHHMYFSYVNTPPSTRITDINNIRVPNEHVDQDMTRHNSTSSQHEPANDDADIDKDNVGQSCEWYVAKSVIGADSGLGIFTTKPIKKGGQVGLADIVIQLHDLNPYYAEALRVLLFDYAWDGAGKYR